MGQKIGGTGVRNVMVQNKDREITPQSLLGAEWAERREWNLILNLWLLIGKLMPSIETLQENTFPPLCQAQAQHRCPCPSLSVFCGWDWFLLLPVPQSWAVLSTLSPSTCH